MAKIEIPANLKSDLPPSIWGKILSATPVVMAVIATMLAGLSSSEMTKAQYDRSYAAQLQSKAGDQWGYFQAKRQRGASNRNALDLLGALSAVQPVDTARFRQAAGAIPPGPDGDRAGADLFSLLESAGGQEAITALNRGELPVTVKPAPLDPAIRAVQAAIETGTEAESAGKLNALEPRVVAEAMVAARAKVQEFDTALAPLNQTIDALDVWLARNSKNAGDLFRDFTAARLRLAAARYDAEARLNQVIASLYEIQVRKNNLSAERHHNRSQRFFYGMLGAQMAVIIATFAIAARQRNLLWALAAGAGVIAVLFAVYVYVFV